MLILLFMAVTSSTSAELIAVSSLLTFDVYKTYINPNASSHRLVAVSHAGIAIFAVVLAVFCCILNAVGLDLTWLVTVLAIIVGGSAVPVGLILLWKRTSTPAVTLSPLIGLTCGLTAWFVTASKRSGEISIASTGEVTNAVAGNVTSFGVGWLSCVVLSFAFPAKHTSTDARRVEESNKVLGIANPQAAAGIPQVDTSTPEKSIQAENGQDEKTVKDHSHERSTSESKPGAVITTGNDLVDFLENSNMEPMDPVEVKKGERLAVAMNLIFLSIAVFLVPFTLFGTGYVYSRRFFTGWVVMSFIWVWTSMCICVIYPLVESAGALRVISAGLWTDGKALFGSKRVRAGTSAGGA